MSPAKFVIKLQILSPRFCSSVCFKADASLLRYFVFVFSFMALLTLEGLIGCMGRAFIRKYDVR